MNDEGKHYTVIPSVHKLSTLEAALRSPSPYVLLTKVHLGNLVQLTEHCHSMNKKVLIRPESVEGVRADQRGVQMLKQYFHVDGIMTSSYNTATFGSDVGLEVYWRLFLLDSRALETSLSIMENRNWTGFEALPAPMAIEHASMLIPAATGRPIFGGGFVSTHETVKKLAAAGFAGATSSTKSLWSPESSVERKKSANLAATKEKR